MSNQVQAMTIAMFGAAAGSYTAELETSVDASGVAAVANSIMGLQQPLLGIDLSDDGVWTDFVLGNLGINDTNAAYGTAAAYFAARFEAGATRGDIIAEAVAYLLDTVSAEFTAVAAGFVTQVEAAEEWSVGDGDSAFAIGDLRDAVGNTTGAAATFNLTAALATLTAAQEAEQAALDVVAEADAANDIDAGSEVDAEGEYALDYDATDAALELDAAETAAAEAYDADQNAIANLALARLATSDAALASAATAAQTAITDAEAQDEYDDYVAALPAAEATQTTLDDVTGDLAAANAYFESLAGETLVDGEDGTFWIDSGDEAGYQEGDDTLIVDYDAEAEASVAAGELTDEDYAGLTDLVTAVNAYVAAFTADAEADVAAADAFDALDAMDGETDGSIDLYDDLDDANTAVDVRDGLVEDVAEAADALATAEAYAAELADLVAAYEAAADDTTAAAEAITEANYILATDGTSTVDMDVYTADLGILTIADFSAGDVISVAGFTFNSGDSTATNNFNALEFFVEEVADDLVVTFETETYGSDSGDVVTLTLTGLSLADVSIGSTYIIAA